MRKTVLTLSLVAAGLFGLMANAQEVTSNEEYLAQTPANKVAFEPTSSHWFIQALGGINVPFYTHWKEGNTIEAQRDADFGDKFSWSAGIAFGQWHSPYFGTRLAIDYNNLVAFADPKTSVELRSINPHFDFMFDLVNYFSPYDENRVFHVVPYLGVGYFGSNLPGATQEATDDNFKAIFNDDRANGAEDQFWGEIDHAISANIGIDFNINFTPRVALTIAPSATFVPGYGYGDIITGIRGGLTFNVGDVAFNGVQPMDWDLVNGLQSQINDLRSQNAELSKRPVRCPECPEVKEPIVEKSYENVVYFRIDSPKIDKNQEINVFNTAEYVKANNMAITVTGYADVETGSADYNMKLSEKRARNVADKLINEYGVPSNLITIDYKGSEVQPYDVNAWNRVVIMKTK